MDIKNILIGLAAAPTIAVAGALVNEAITGTFFDTATFLIAILFGIVIAVALIIGYPKTQKTKQPKQFSKFIAGAIVFGFILIPYMQFFVGQINIFFVDPPEFRPSVDVPQIRVQIDSIDMTNDQGQAVNVLPQTQVHTLVPGGNKVNIGALNIPAGNYNKIGVRIGIIEVDINIDTNIEADLIYNDVKELLPPQATADIVKPIIKDRTKAMFESGTIVQMIQQQAGGMASVKKSAVVGDVVQMTLALNAPLIEFPVMIPYPVGRGGPDIVFDVVLNEIGFPTDIKPQITLPPGAPEIPLPDIMSYVRQGMQPPTQIGPSKEQILQYFSEGSAQAEEIKRQAIASATQQALAQGATQEQIDQVLAACSDVPDPASCAQSYITGFIPEGADAEAAAAGAEQAAAGAQAQAIGEAQKIAAVTAACQSAPDPEACIQQSV
ncbi:MAG: hypothetical protein J4432_02945 [DPANN group archaeon]|nr:hypothetical protein [DPANN group archaeon]